MCRPAKKPRPASRANRGVLSALTHTMLMSQAAPPAGRPSNGCVCRLSVASLIKRRIRHAGRVDRARQKACRLAHAELGSEIAGDVDRLRRAPRRRLGAGGAGLVGASARAESPRR